MSPDCDTTYWEGQEGEQEYHTCYKCIVEARACTLLHLLTCGIRIHKHVHTHAHTHTHTHTHTHSQGGGADEYSQLNRGKGVSTLPGAVHPPPSDPSHGKLEKVHMYCTHCMWAVVCTVCYVMGRCELTLCLCTVNSLPLPSLPLSRSAKVLMYLISVTDIYKASVTTQDITIAKHLSNVLLSLYTMGVCIHVLCSCSQPTLCH